MIERATPTLTRTLVGGLVGGLVASAAMTGSQLILARAAEAAGGDTDREPTGQTMADVVSKAATGDPVPDGARDAAGKAVHFATGAGLGALYTLAARWLPEVRAGYGTAYGAAVSAVLDEGLVAALGLAPPPGEVPLADHAEGLAAHVVFGLALEATVRVLVGRAE